MSTVQILQPPVLDIDVECERRFGWGVQAQGKLERRIVWNMFAYLLARGWAPVSVWDGEERHPVADAKAAMELVFDLDEATVCFMHKPTDSNETTHSVVLVLGNGVDVISDYGYSDGDADGFRAAMHAFDAEVFA